jgi:acetoin utilization protein AcuB
MTRRPVTVGPDDSLRTVQLLMRQGHFRRLPVVEGKRVIGIVTDRDLWERSPSGVMNGGQHVSDDLKDHLRVMGIMTLQPVTVTPTTSIVEAARLLRLKKVGALLVIEDGELLGIITKGDLIDALLEEGDQAAATALRS